MIQQMKTILFSTLVATSTMLACGSVEIDPQAAVISNADLANYISVGSGLTAGYAAGGLYREAQLNSYPSILANQLKTVGTATFNQPLFDTKQADGSGYLVVKSLLPLTTAKSEALTGVRSTTPLLFAKYSGANNNFGVPHLKMMDIGKPSLGNPSKANFNAFFERILTDTDLDKSYIDYVKASKYTFFTCEVGINDVLDYALSGGTKTLSPIESFAPNCRQLFAGLTANNAKGLVLNIPNVTAFPAFVRVATLGQKNGIFIESNGMVRKATDSEVILASAAEKIGKKNGKDSNYGLNEAEPILNTEVLDETELKKISLSIADLNAVIGVEAASKNLKVVNINDLYTKLTNGSLSVNGLAVKGNVSKEGFFSADGVYPTPRGQAILANEIIKALNEDLTAKSLPNIPTVDVAKFKSVEVK